MGCNCGGKKPRGTQASLKRSFQIPTDVSGALASGTVTECSGPYTGPHEDRVVYMVAIGTENEQAFGRDRRATAMNLATRNEWTIDPLRAGDLCHEVVVAALGE
jgi:hypothetical protein